MESIYDHFYSNTSIYNDRYSKTLSNVNKDQADKYLLVHNHDKTQFAPLVPIRYGVAPLKYSIDNSSKLSFCGLQNIRPYQKPVICRNIFNETNAEKTKNMSKLQIIEERIAHLEHKNYELELSNSVFLNVFHEVMKNKVYRDKFINKNLKKMNPEDKAKIEEMFHIADDPHNEFDSEGNLQKHSQQISQIPFALNDLKRDIAMTITQNNATNSNAMNSILDQLKNLRMDVTKEMETTKRKQKENMALMETLVTANSSDKLQAKRIIGNRKSVLNLHDSPKSQIKEKDSQGNSIPESQVNSNHKTEEDNPVISVLPLPHRRKKKGKTATNLLSDIKNDNPDNLPLRKRKKAQSASEYI